MYSLIGTWSSLMAATSALASSAQNFDHVSSSRLQHRQQPANTFWCGALEPGKYSKVYGKWTLPKISLKDGENYSDLPNVAFGVGVDQRICDTWIEAGFQTWIDNYGTHHTFSSVQFYPDAAKDQSITASEGDQVSILVEVDSSGTKATVTLKNYTTKKSQTTSSTAPSGKKLCFSAAGWGLEWTGSPVAAFSTFTVTPSAKTFDGASAKLDGNTPHYNISQLGSGYCKSYVQSGQIVFDDKYDPFTNS